MTSCASDTRLAKSKFYLVILLIGVMGCQSETVSQVDPATAISTGPLAENSTSTTTQSSQAVSAEFSVDSALLEDFAWIKDASPRAKSQIVRGFARSDKPLTKYGIDGNLNSLLHFLSQSATETGGFRTLEESTSYSADRLVAVFPSRVTKERAALLERRPRETANFIYGDRLGNVEGTDDGWNYRGSGYLQLTGRYNFEKIGDRLGVALENQAETVRLPVAGLDASLEYWKWRGVGQIAENGGVREVRYAINGGENGLPEARVWYEVFKNAYRSRGGVELESSALGVDSVDAAVAKALAEFGFLDEPDLESTFTSGRYGEGLAQFQQVRELEPTGVFDEDTLYAITDPLGKFEHLD